MFFKLTGFAEFEKNPEKMKSILEMPDISGETVVIDVTLISSIKILDYLLKNKIKMNNCTSSFGTAEFTNVEVTNRILRHVNPKIINKFNYSQLYDYYPQNFFGSLIHYHCMTTVIRSNHRAKF